MVFIVIIHGLIVCIVFNSSINILNVKRCILTRYISFIFFSSSSFDSYKNYLMNNNYENLNN